MTKLRPTSLWLLRFMVERLPGGYATHLTMPYDTPLGVCMQTMRGLERRGYVTEVQSGLFKATDKGVAEWEKNKVIHVKSVLVRRCDFNIAVNCAGNESGCSSSACTRDVKWERVSHEQFVADYERCPLQCTKEVKRDA